jgi:hypothetical protein
VALRPVTRRLVRQHDEEAEHAEEDGAHEDEERADAEVLDAAADLLHGAGILGHTKAMADAQGGVRQWSVTKIMCLSY